jgi:hypothetical protein
MKTNDGLAEIIKLCFSSHTRIYLLKIEKGSIVPSRSNSWAFLCNLGLAQNSSMTSNNRKLECTRPYLSKRKDNIVTNGTWKWE